MHIGRAEIATVLRSRGLVERADWVERTMPQQVDIHTNSALLQLLGIDPAAMAPVETAAPRD